MSVLEIPERLKGPWDHVLIMTYGLDLPFFEGALWQQLATRCRNKIILADGQHYLEACTQYARKEGFVNHLNQSYIAAGIFGPRAAHGKLILLTNPEQGWLLVGSGNLGWQGYASGGEMFTLYEYSATNREALPAFLAVRELVDGLASRRYIEAAAARRLEYLWERTPWLFQASTTAAWSVRHNLTRSFLDQLQDEIGGDPVEELWVLTPFYDREALALARLLSTVQPQRATLLLQPGKTSVDPDALQRVIDAAFCPCDVRAFRLGSVDPYVHAKCYLFKLADRALCLQGSPNLSQVAFLWSDPRANVEVANLLTGPRDAFDELLDALEIDATPTRPAMLKLAYQDQTTPDSLSEEGWRLTGGEWWAEQLVLNFQGTLPDLRGAELVIARTPFTLQVRKRETQSLELVISQEAAGLLSRPVPLHLRWRNAESLRESNPIFVCNRAALKATLELPTEGEKLDRIGDLDLDDKEIEELLGDLNEALIIDRRSLWQLAGRAIPSNGEEDDRSLHLAYADIDYDRLRQHPKIQQYMYGAPSGQGYARSRLQIILNAIIAHFQQREPVSTALMSIVETDLEESEDAPIQERSAAAEDKQSRSWSAKLRVGQLLKRFIQRYLRGLRSPDFQAFVGGEVITTNYLIFTHLLWRLFAKDWVEPAFIMDALSETWSFFWGTEGQPGYFYVLPLDEQVQALQQLEDCSTDAVLFATFYYSAKLAVHARWEKRLFTLRDCWRAFLCRTPFPLLKPLLATAQRRLSQLLPYDPPSPVEIVDQLSRLAHFETRASFLQRLETAGRYPADSFTFIKEDIWRTSLGRRVSVDCLLVRVPEALAEKDDAVALLQEWMLAERLDYYRIAASRREAPSTTTHVIFYEVAEQRGKYWVRDRGGPAQDLAALPLPARAWDPPLAQLQTLAAQLA